MPYIRDIDFFVECFDLENTYYDKYKSFNNCSAPIEHLYLRHLRILKIKTKDTAKVVVEIPTDGSKQMKTYNHLLDVIELFWPFKFKTYWKLNDHDKKMKILNAIHEALLFLAEKEGWPTTSFNKAYKACIKSGLNNEWFIDRMITSPNKIIKAQIFVAYKEDALYVYLVIFNKYRQEIHRILWGKYDDDEELYRDICRLKFISDNKIAVISRNKSICFTKTIPKSCFI
jgi:hypothetical protein